MTNISINIQCGPHTCAKKPGEFCQFMGLTRMGTVSVCRLFPDDEYAFTVLEDQNGWLMRCQACLSAEMDDPTVVLRKRLHDLELDLVNHNKDAE